MYVCFVFILNLIYFRTGCVTAAICLILWFLSSLLSVACFSFPTVLVQHRAAFGVHVLCALVWSLLFCAVRFRCVLVLLPDTLFSVVERKKIIRPVYPITETHWFQQM